MCKTWITKMVWNISLIWLLLLSQLHLTQRKRIVSKIYWNYHYCTANVLTVENADVCLCSKSKYNHELYLQSFVCALQIYTTTLLLFYILKDVLLQPNEATNIGCTPIQLLYNYYTANSSIYYNIFYEQLIFVRITAIGSSRQVCTSLLQLKRCTLSLSTAG